MIDQLCVQNFEIMEKLKIEALEMSNILKTISKKTAMFLQRNYQLSEKQFLY